jgi:hypothetical protein
MELSMAKNTIVNGKRTIDVTYSTAMGRPREKPGVLIHITHGSPFMSSYIHLTPHEAGALAKLIVDGALKSQDNFKAFKQKLKAYAKAKKESL